MQFIFILVSFLASMIGSVCGIGGGVIIKPVLDAFGAYSASTNSFVSGCIVLAMTGYSVLKAKFARESVIEKGTSTNLGVGAALGGFIGKQLFDMIRALFENPNTVGAVQAAVLFVITLGTAVYTLCKSRIKPYRLTNPIACALVGLCLGLVSAFLGIGGGPINFVVLHFFFCMKTKVAVQNSLYIILLSQLASVIFTLACGNVSEFPAMLFAIMVLCGILGGMVGRSISKRIGDGAVNKLFFGLNVVIMGICCYNFVNFIR
jgi:uncharacterized membrane protein YfcA